MTKQVKPFIEMSIKAADSSEVAAQSVEHVALFDQHRNSYYYGMSSYNTLMPIDADSEIELRIARSRWNGLGKYTMGFTEKAGLSEKSYAAHKRNVDDIVKTLAELDLGEYKIARTIVLYSPLKFFVFLENGDAEQTVVYRYVTGFSNGSGKGDVVSKTGKLSPTELYDLKWSYGFIERQQKWWEERPAVIAATIEKHEAELLELTDDAKAGVRDTLNHFLKRAHDDMAAWTAGVGKPAQSYEEFIQLLRNKVRAA